MKKSSAFTLIELLVVIAIIGILATLSVIALSNARAKSRDSKRVADAKQIQTALELFYNDKGRYPSVSEWNTGSIYSTTSGVTTTYMTVIPTAPTPPDSAMCNATTTAYRYYSSADGSDYSLTFCLGGNTGSLSAGIVKASPVGTRSCGSYAVEYEGQSYNTVQIGTQCWMRDNLNIGTMLVGLNTSTNNSLVEKYCYSDTASNCNVYGGLYIWDEAMGYVITNGAQGICPFGWHIPTDGEQDVLDQYLKDPGQTCDANRNVVYDCDAAGGKLKEAGISHWTNPNTGATNSSGFTALPGGTRNSGGGTFLNQGTYSYIWSSTASGVNAWYRNPFYTTSTVRRTASSKAYGFSVRCLQN